MTLDIRKRIFLIVGLAVLFLVLLVLLLLNRSKPTTPPKTVDTNTSDVNTPEQLPPETILNLTPPPPPSTAEEREKLFVVQLSKIFVERYMSYSNQNGNNHINDVRDLITPRMVTFLETQKIPFSNDYKGSTTKVISSSLASFESQKASVTIGIQQFLEEDNKPTGSTAYKNGTVSLIKGESGWKVDGLFWEDVNASEETVSTP